MSRPHTSITTGAISGWRHIASGTNTPASAKTNMRCPPTTAWPASSPTAAEPAVTPIQYLKPSGIRARNGWRPS